ncbi:MAG: TonB family protein [Bdellovibrionales bacterium]|nr:TonB family protein [Bdellovibrionales bacterium]
MQSYEFTSQSDVKPAIGPSAILHGTIFFLLIFKTFVFPSETLEYIPSVRVDLVALPEKMKKVDPIPTPQTKEVEKPKEVPVKKAEVKSEEKLVIKPKPDQKPKPENSIDKIRKELEAEKAAQEKAKATPQPEPEYKGNRLNPGTALQGIHKIDFSNYQHAIYLHAKSNWIIPKWLSDSTLNADVLITLDEKGYVISKRVSRSSGDTSYDQSVLEAIERASPFPPPEERFIDILAVSGVQITFKP